LTGMDLTTCPECGLVAEVVDRDAWPSTDGPVEHAHVRCVAGHRFVLPVATLAMHHVVAQPHRSRRGRAVSARGRRDGIAP
jgi:hypothetical protein